MLEKTVNISGTEVRFRSSAAIPRLYRIKFKRDIFKDLSKLEASYKGKTTGDGEIPIEDLEIFENVAYVMAYHADHTIRVEGTVAHGAEGNALANQLFFAGQTQHTVLHTGGQDHGLSFIYVAILGGNAEDITLLLKARNGLQLHIRAQVHCLLNELFSKFCAADLDGAGDVLYLGRKGDLTAEAGLLDDQNGLTCPEGIYCRGQACRTAANNQYIIHHNSSFLEKQPSFHSAVLLDYRLARYFLISGTL